MTVTNHRTNSLVTCDGSHLLVQFTRSYFGLTGSGIVRGVVVYVTGFKTRIRTDSSTGFFNTVTSYQT